MPKISSKLSDLGDHFELQVLSLLLHDAGFVGSYYGLLKPSHFDSAVYQSIALKLMGFYAKYRRTPDRLESINIITQKLSPDQEIEAKHHIALVNKLWETDVPNKGYIVEHLVEFIQKSETLRVFAEVIQEKRELDVGALSKELQRISSISESNEDLGLTSEQFINKLLTRDEEPEGLLTGFPSFDAVMKHGLRPGELTVILGGTGIGKTTTLCNLGKGLRMSGAKVVHLSLEMPEDRVMDKYIASMTKIPIDNLVEIENLREVIEELRSSDIVSPKDLRIKYKQGNAVTMEDIENYIVRLVAAGEKIDVLIVDYADLIAPPRSYGSTGNKRLELGDVYVSLRNLGDRYGFPILTVSQINREGKKLGYNFKTGHYDAFPVKLQDFHMDDSQKKANHADFIFAIREPKIYLPFNSDGKSKLFIIDAIKTRYGEKDQVLVFNMRFHESWMEDRTENFDFEEAMSTLRVQHTLDAESSL